jgi:hypothetical protein
MDIEVFKPGDDFVDILHREIESCDVLLAIIDRDWSESLLVERAYDFIKIEIQAAFESGKTVIPVLVDGAELPKADTLPESLQALADLPPVVLGAQTFDVDYAALRSLILHELAQADVKRRMRRPEHVDRQTAPPQANRPSRRSENPTTKVFISYRRQDAKAVATLIYRSLREVFGSAAVFMDVHGIPLGADFHKYLTEQVLNARVVLALIADRWLTATDEAGHRRLDNPDDFVRIEIEAALDNEVPVVPLYVDGARPLTAETLPASLKPLARRHGAFLDTGRGFEADLAQLIDDLKPRLN